MSATAVTVPPQPAPIIPDPNPNQEPAPIIPDPNPNQEPAPIIPDPAPEPIPDPGAVPEASVPEAVG